MKLYLKASIVTVVVGLVFVAAFWKWYQNTHQTVGVQRMSTIEQMERDGLPQFSGRTLSGADLELADFKDKVVIVSFWASWCGPCLEEFPSMIELSKKMGDRVQIVAVSQDSNREDIEIFLKAFPGVNNPNFHIVWDETREIGRLYNADRLPESFIAKPGLKLARKIVGSIEWATPDAIKYMESLVGAQ